MNVAPRMITDQNSLVEYCERLRRNGRFAFDTEFIRDDTYHAALCLIQVNDGQEVTLIDPTADLDVAGFWSLVCDPAILTIVHAGKEDFEVCLRETGQPPRNVFDVQVVAGFVGLGYPLSLQRLVSLTLKHRLTKAQTLTDWLRRPLTDDQLRYAVEDVQHLPAIHERFAAALSKSGRTAWAAEELARFEDPAFYRPTAQARLFRIRGVNRLDGQSLAVLQRLMEWRDQWAQQRNRPTRALMRDDVLVEIARRRCSRASDLEVLRGFAQSKNRRVVEELLRVIREASETPETLWPTPVEVREEPPMYKAATDVLSAYLRSVCHDEGVSNDLVGGPQRLRELLDYATGQSKDKPMLLAGWRGEFIGRRLLELLEGRCALRLVGFPSELHVKATPVPR